MEHTPDLMVVTIASHVDERINLLRESCTNNNLELTILGEGVKWISNAVKFRIINDFLKDQPENQMILFVDAYDVYLNGSAEEIISKFNSFKTDIVFSAESNFFFKKKHLRYYYWKYYPRLHKKYNYLNSGSYMGRASSLRTMIQEITRFYKVDLNNDAQLKDIESDQYLFNRYYVDQYHHGITSENSITLDYSQELFACTAGRQWVVRWPMLTWIQSFLFFRYERRLLKLFRLQERQNTILDLKYVKKTKSFFNKVTKTNPVVIHLPRTEKRFEKLINRLKKNSINLSFLHLPAVLVSFVAWLESFFSSSIATLINVGVTDPKRIYRFTPNSNPEWDQGIKKFIEHLRKKESFAFAHFNDGELTFIKKHLDEDTKKTWYGRGQQSYDDLLGKRLLSSIQENRKNYYVGIPCSTCWPEHRALANDLTKEVDNTIPAMIFHHNLSFIPAIINELRDREVFFIGNENQNYSILGELGVNVKEENRTNVPFVNSYVLYEQMKDRKFPEGSIVLLTCGMLAKILIPTWFANNPNVTFLALGSALDDLIQKENMRFILFPKFLPISSNVYPTKYFLFGRKKICNECYPRYTGD